MDDWYSRFLLQRRHLSLGVVVVLAVVMVVVVVVVVMMMVVIIAGNFVVSVYFCCFSAWVCVCRLSLALARARFLRVACLIVSFLLEPAAWVSAQVESSRLVVDEDGEHEWNSRQPPDEFEREHSETLVHAGRVT